MATFAELEQQRLAALRRASEDPAGSVQETSKIEQLQAALKQFGPSLTNPTQPDYDKEAAGAIEDSYTRLSEILNASPNVDFEGMAAPFIQRMRTRRTEPRPGRMEAFAAGFGSQEGAQSVMQRVAAAQASENAKERDLGDMEAKILEAKINEAMSKGQTSRALSTMKERQALEHRLGRFRAREEQQFKVELEGVKQQQREKQNVAILDRIRERTKASGGAGMSFDDRVALKLIDAVVKARLARNMLTGKRDLDEADVDDVIMEVTDMLKELRPRTPPKAGVTTPPPPAAKSRARIAADRLIKERGQPQ